MADRIYLDKKNIELIKNTIRKNNLLNLDSDGENIDVFMLALSLGVNEGRRTPSEHKEGFILESVFDEKSEFKSYFYSVALQELLKDHRESEIDNTSVVYQIAEEYANTGFQVLLEMIGDIDHYDSEVLVYKIIEKLDDLIPQD